MQPTHLAPLFQALRQDGRALAWAFGAIAGAAGYFGWPTDLVWELGLVPLGIGLLLAAFWREGGWFLVAAGLVFALAGMQVERAAREFNWAVAARKPHWVTGRVAEMIPQKDNEARVTLVLREVKFYQLPGSGGVREVRAGVFRNQVKDVAVGDGVAVPILLVAPEGPKFRGDRDMRLWRFLDREVVRGYARGAAWPTWLPPSPPARFERAGLALEAVRAKIAAASGGRAEGVVAALLVGDQRGVTPEVRAAYRATGLTHLIAISGMQLTLVGGGIFFVLRWLAAWWPMLALRVNVKAYAALAGLLGAAGYTLLAGAGVGVIRAFVMVALVMVAVLTGRMRSGIRAWCVAVGLILLVNPAMVLSAGFQLSVAAVLGLVVWGIGEEKPRGVIGWGRGMVLSSVVAGAATAPLVVMNFSQLSAVGLLANVVAVPLMGVATYAGMVGLLAWPVGLEGPVLDAMAWVVGLVNRWAVWLAGWPGSVVVAAGWWPWVAVAGLAALTGVVARWWGVALVGVMALAGLAWGASHMQVPIQVAVLDGGKVGIEGGRLVWAEDRRDAGYLVERAGFGKAGEGAENASEVVDEGLMPVTPYERFAWAEKRGGVWQVEPLRCRRVWQRVDEACYGDGYKEETAGE